jgi:sugar lactone lactonase YvrE
MSRDGVSWGRVPAADGVLFEGPRWIAEAGVFQWVDILSATVHRWDPYGSDPSENRETGLEFATVALPLDADRMLIGSRSSLHVYSWRDRTLETVGEWDFPPDVRFNDGAVAPGGEVYIGSMSMERRKGAAALYRFDLTSRSLTVVADSVGISNGLHWDSASSGYYIDSLEPRIDRVTVADGQLDRRLWLELAHDDEPDGLTVAADGSVVVAMWGGSRLVVATPARDLRAVPVPALFPTSVAFGGVDGELVLVTAAAGDHGEDAPARILVGATAELLEAGGSS